MNGRKLRRCVEAGSNTWFSPEKLLAVSNLDARPTKDPRAHFRRFVRSGMQELGLANPVLAGKEERPTVRRCPSPEGPEPVDLRVAPNEAPGWRAAAGPFLRLWDAGVEHGTLSGAGPHESEA